MQDARKDTHMAEKKVVVKSPVRDPETFEVFRQGSYEVGEEQAYRLTSSHPEHVESLDERATEAAAKEAEKSGVDLAGVEGSGSGGKVTKKDVEQVKK